MDPSLHRSYTGGLVSLLPALLFACSSSSEVLTTSDQFRANTMDTMSEEGFFEEEEAEGVNRKPRIINVRVNPQEVYGSTDIEVLFRVEDPEGDPISTSFQWYVNNRKRLGKVSRTLKSNSFRKGDRLVVEIRATDGTHTVTGKSREIEVLNSPPEMLTKPGSLGNLDGTTIRAVDPDGDSLRYFLEEAPPGLSIDERRGVLRYASSMNSDASGEFRTRIVAEDPEGARVVFPLTLQVTPGQSGAPAEPE